MKYKFTGIMLILILLLIMLTSCSAVANNDDVPNQQLAADYNVQLGLAYLKKNDIPSAKSKLLLVLQQAPEWPVAQDAMGYFWETTGDKKQAESYYLHAIDLAPKNGAGLNNYGAFLCREGQYNQAEKMFLKAVADSNYLNTANAYENAGICMMMMPVKNISLIKYYFEKAKQQDPSLSVSIDQLMSQLGNR